MSSEETVIQYPSAELLLQVTREARLQEDERAKTLDSRVGVFIPLVGALLALISTFVKIPSNNTLKVSSVYQASPYVIYIILLLLTLLLLVSAIIYFIRVIASRQYKRVVLSDFLNEANVTSSKDIVAYALIQSFVIDCQHNSKINDEKYRLYSRGMFCIATGIVCAVILYVLHIILGT